MSAASATEGSEKKEVRILLLGRTGVGKSSLWNRILGKDEFLTSDGIKSQTNSCEKASREFGDKRLVVVDTPGLFNNNIKEDELWRELLGSFESLSPGPHVILLVLQFRNFKSEDEAVIKAFQNATEHTFVVFTCGDRKKRTDEWEKKRGVKRDEPKSIKDLCKDESKYHVFENKNTPEQETKKLLQKITTMFDQMEGKHYDLKLFQEAEKAFKELPSAWRASAEPGKEDKQITQKLVETVEKISGCRALKDVIDSVDEFVNKKLE